jgi:hypothetical protein
MGTLNGKPCLHDKVVHSVKEAGSFVHWYRKLNIKNLMGQLRLGFYITRHTVLKGIFQFTYVCA